MPPPKKLDLIPEQFRDWLKVTLSERGFGDILDVTDELNFRLEAEGLELRLGKTAVGEYSKLLKDQREAFSMAETLLADMDIEAEGDLQRTLMQMIATSAVHMMQSIRNEDGHLEPKDLMQLAKMLKDLMGSSGMREKLLADERERIALKARKDAVAAVEKSAKDLGMSQATVDTIKGEIMGIAS